MAATFAAFSLGDSVGALLGPFLIQRGMIANALAAVVLNLVGLFLLVAYIKPVQDSNAT